MKIRLAEKIFLVLVILSYAVFQRWLRGTVAGFINIGSINILAFMMLAIVEIGTLILFIKYNRLILMMIRRNRLLLLFPFLMLLSTVWSLEKPHTFIYSIHLLLTTILVFYIAARFSLREFIQILAIGLGIIAILSLIVVVLRPDAAIHHGLHEGNWRGIYFHKNGMCREMAIAALVFLISAKEKFLPKMLAITGFLLCTLLVIKALAMTGLVALVTVLALYPFLRAMRFQFSVKVLIPIVVLLSAGIIGVYLADNYVSVLHQLGKDATLTNRVFIWGYSFDSFLERPLLGYGYNAFWQDKERILAAVNWPSPHAHNHFFELLLDAGAVGVFLFLLIFIKTLWRAVKRLFRGNTSMTWHILLLILLVLITFTEKGIHWPYNLLWLTFACSVCYLSESAKVENAPLPEIVA